MRNSFPLWMRGARFRRGFAIGAVVLAAGGLILHRSSASAFPAASSDDRVLADGKNSVSFRGAGAHGALSLSHTKVLGDTRTPVYAELKFVAERSDNPKIRAPVSLAVVLDTSGSMNGDKIEDAKRSVLRLLSEMRDEDEIALVRYSDTSELIQPLAPVGTVRSALVSRVRELSTGGGTNIPGGLSQGLRAIDDAAKGRVRRIVLVSDGLDDTRDRAADLARASFASGITVSSLGIGLDFDERYMGAVAESGHGNFAFIKDAGSLASFLARELEETAGTTIENARVTIEVPSEMHFVSVSGADANVQGRSIELRLGSLFAGDERRVIVELSVDTLRAGDSVRIVTDASWNRVGKDTSTVSIPSLRLMATSSPSEMERGRDGSVLASATSVISSKRQLEATGAYARGDVATAAMISSQNERALREVLLAAPPSDKPRLAAQLNAYSAQKTGFASYGPSSAEGKTIAKAAAVKDLDNLHRASSF